MTRTEELRSRAIAAFRGILDDKEPRREVIPAMLGDVEGTCEVPGKEAFSYVRPYGLDKERLTAYNGGRIRNVANVPILIEIFSRVGQAPMATILGRDYYGDPAWDEGTYPYYIARHALTHEAKPGEGDDVLNVYARAITELRADQQATPAMTVQVRSGLWYYGTTPKYFDGGNSPTFTAPAVGYRWDLLYLTSGNVLTITQGIAAGIEPLAIRPDPTANTLPVAYILLHDTTTTITDSEIYDARQMVDQILSTAVGLHATQHENGGADEIDVVGLSGLLADGQTPLAHKTSHEDGGSDEISVLNLSGLLADGQTPLAHKASHQNGGGDEISVAALSGVLADEQDAGWIKGVVVDDAAIADNRILVYDVVSGDLVYEVQSGGGGAGGMGYSSPTWHVDGALAVLANVGEAFRMPQGGTITEVILIVPTQGSANSTIVDVNKNGVTIFTVQGDRPEVVWNDGDDYDVGVPAVTAFVQYDEFTCDIDAVGTDASDMRVILVVAGWDVGFNAIDKTVTPAPNGVLVVFTIEGAAYVPGTLAVYLNGQRQVKGVDYSETTPASGTFTFVVAPAIGDIIRCDYNEGSFNTDFGSGGIKADIVDESTAAAGVTVEGLLIKDGIIDPRADKYYGRNLIKNSPGQIAVDGAEPQWWDDIADAVITDEDTVGEGIPDIHERCFKVVTAANDVYGYQTFTLADEALLDAGVTEVSLGVWSYCATAAKASVGIYGTNLGLQESAQVGALDWTFLTVEGITLDAGDASIQVRFIVDTNTAFFTMPMFNIGPKALPWCPRGLKKVVKPAKATQIDLNPTGDVAWTNSDATANTGNLAVMVDLFGRINEADGSLGSQIQFGHGLALTGGADDGCFIQGVLVLAISHYFSCDVLSLQDDGTFRYMVNEVDADSDVVVKVWLHAYWMWE